MRDLILEQVKNWDKEKATSYKLDENEFSPSNIPKGNIIIGSISKPLLEYNEEKGKWILHTTNNDPELIQLFENINVNVQEVLKSNIKLIEQIEQLKHEKQKMIEIVAQVFEPPKDWGYDNTLNLTTDYYLNCWDEWFKVKLKGEEI